MSQPSPLTPALQRAQTLVANGDLGGALVLLERAVELGRENLGEDHNDVLAAQRELAGVLVRVDEPVQARRTLEQAYATGHLRLGDSDPLLLQISHDLGVIAEELGNRHEARKAFGRVAEHGPGALGVRHPLVARAQAYLGQDQNQADVREEAPSPVVADPETVPTPVEVHPPDAMNEPTGAFPAVPDQGHPGAWNAPPGQAAPPAPLPAPSRRRLPWLPLRTTPGPPHRRPPHGRRPTTRPFPHGPRTASPPGRTTNDTTATSPAASPSGRALLPHRQSPHPPS